MPHGGAGRGRRGPPGCTGFLARAHVCFPALLCQHSKFRYQRWRLRLLTSPHVPCPAPIPFPCLGWITLLPETSAPLRAAAAVAAAAWEQRTGERRRAGSGGGGGVRDPGPDWHDAYHAYYTQHHPQSGFTGSYLPLIGGKRRHLSNSQAHGQAQREQQVPGQQGAGVVGEKEAAGGGQGVGGAGGAGRGREVDVSERGWRAAVAEGEAYTVPLTAEEAAAARAGAGGQQQRQQQQATGPQRHRGGTEAAGQGGAGEDRWHRHGWGMALCAHRLRAEPHLTPHVQVRARCLFGVMLVHVVSVRHHRNLPRRPCPPPPLPSSVMALPLHAGGAAALRRLLRPAPPGVGARCPGPWVLLHHAAWPLGCCLSPLSRPDTRAHLSEPC